MKKITLVLCALLLTAGVTKAGEYVAFQPSAPVAISWESNERLTFKDFLTLSVGDMVKIHVTNIATDYSASVNLQVGNNWQWVEIPNIHKDFDNGIIWFTIERGTAYWGENNSNSQVFEAEDIADLIKERGLVIDGYHFKVLDITVQSDDVADNGSFSQTLMESMESYDLDWNSRDIISENELKYTYTSGDYITADVSLTNKNTYGQVIFEAKGGGENNNAYQLDKGYVLIRPEDIRPEEAESPVTITITITDNELEDIQTYGLQLKGENTTVTNVQYHYTPAKAGYRPVYIPESGYATFCGASTCALPDGVNAYCVSSIAGNKAMTTQLSNIPASQGVILEGDEGIYQLYATTDEPDAVTSNLLTGVTTRTQITDASNKYVLFNNSGTPEFRTITADTYLDPFKAYLNASTPNAGARIALSFDNETNGIDELKQQTTGSKQMFDLQGRRIAKSTRGLYIVNGKKVFVK